jgi:hypothetical protein
MEHKSPCDDFSVITSILQGGDTAAMLSAMRHIVVLLTKGDALLDVIQLHPLIASLSSILCQSHSDTTTNHATRNTLKTIASCVNTSISMDSLACNSVRPPCHWLLLAGRGLWVHFTWPNRSKKFDPPGTTWCIEDHASMPSPFTWVCKWCEMHCGHSLAAFIAAYRCGVWMCWCPVVDVLYGSRSCLCRGKILLRFDCTYTYTPSDDR